MTRLPFFRVGNETELSLAENGLSFLERKKKIREKAKCTSDLRPALVCARFVRMMSTATAAAATHRPPQTSLLPATETSVRHHLRALGYGDVPNEVVQDFVQELNQLESSKEDQQGAEAPETGKVYTTTSSSYHASRTSPSQSQKPIRHAHPLRYPADQPHTSSASPSAAAAAEAAVPPYYGYQSDASASAKQQPYQRKVNDSVHSSSSARLSSLPETYSYRSLQKPSTATSRTTPSAAAVAAAAARSKEVDLNASTALVELETVDEDVVRKQLRDLGYADSAIPESVILEFTRELQEMYNDERERNQQQQQQQSQYRPSQRYSPNKTARIQQASAQERQKEHERALDQELRSNTRYSQDLQLSRGTIDHGDEQDDDLVAALGAEAAMTAKGTERSKSPRSASNRSLSTYPTGTNHGLRRQPQTPIARYAVPPEPSRLKHDPVARYHALQREWNNDNFLRRMNGKPQKASASRPGTAYSQQQQSGRLRELNAVEQLIKEAQVRHRLRFSSCQLQAPVLILI